MTNSELKQKIKKSGFTLWQVAEQIGISEMSLIRWLRSERDTRNQDKVIKALDELITGKEISNNG